MVGGGDVGVGRRNTNGDQDGILMQTMISRNYLPSGRSLGLPLPLIWDGYPPPNYEYDLGPWRPVI